LNLLCTVCDCIRWEVEISDGASSSVAVDQCGS